MNEPVNVGAELRALGFLVPSSGTADPCERCGAAAGEPCMRANGHRALVREGTRCSERVR